MKLAMRIAGFAIGGVIGWHLVGPPAPAATEPVPPATHTAPACTSFPRVICQKTA